jgi:hypothetical protein
MATCCPIYCAVSRLASARPVAGWSGSTVQAGSGLGTKCAEEMQQLQLPAVSARLTSKCDLKAKRYSFPCDRPWRPTGL